MKTVFSGTSEVVHIFAQQSQTEGRAGNVFFKRGNYDKEYGDKIYSYGHHYLLGEFIDDNTIMINDRGYSSSTGEHIGKLTSATRQYKQYFTTRTDINLVYEAVLGNKQNLARANKPEKYIQPILALWESMNIYAEFDRKRRKISKKGYNLYHDTRYLEVKGIVKALESNAGDYKDKLNKLAIAQAKAKKIKDAKLIKEAIVKFNNYERDTFRIGDEDYLRISQDGTKVETSQGVKVSVEAAKILYGYIVAGIDVKGKHIENYVVTSINGVLTIGCHHINMESVHSVGKRL